MIVDFGLAKRVTTDDHLTQSGTAVGTPSYMAPEQAAPGRKGAALTMAADVYSLGAILYELLTGQPPFRGETALETLRDALEREPARPRMLNSAVDRDLETVCLKCLEKDPARRYGSAAALAEDLERFLAGEPVQARPVSSVERLHRWCRRNRVLASVSVLAVAGLVAATTVSLLLAVRESAHSAQRDEDAKNLQQALREVVQAQGKTTEALADARRKEAEAEAHRKEADRQRLLEEESFHQAHKAVNEFCIRVSEELRNVTGMQPLRKRLLEDALGYYERFLKQRGQDPKLRRELAEAQFNVAMLASEIGRKADAAKAYRAALAIFQELQKTAPDPLELRLREGNALCNLGIVLQALGRPKEALATYRQAEGHYERVLKSHPRQPLARMGLAEVQSGVGSVLRRAGNFSEAVTYYSKAVAAHEQLLRDYSKAGRRHDALALAYNNLGVAQTHAGMADEAFKSFQKAFAIRERRAREEPKNLGLKMALTGTQRDLALAHRDRGDKQKALELLEEIRTERIRVVASNPSSVKYQTELAGSHVDLGQLHHAAGRLKEALDCYDQGRQIYEKLVRIDGSAPNLRSDLALIHFHVGTLSLGNKQNDQAMRAFSTARTMQEKLVKEHADIFEYHGYLAKTLNNLSLALKRLRRLDEARLVLQQGIECERVVLEQAPRLGGHRQTLTSLYTNLLDVEKTTNRLAEAMAAAVERRKLWPTDGKAQFRAATDLARVADLIGQGKERLSATEEAERSRCAKLVMEALGDAVAAGFRDRRQVESDPALALVRHRDDYRALLADLK
jgi:tetratricopeptide (TPR) repeat protein